MKAAATGGTRFNLVRERIGGLQSVTTEAVERSVIARFEIARL